MSPSSAVLRPYVWAYGMTTGRVQSAPLLVPLPARPKQLLTFSFADRYCSLRPGSGQHDASPRATVVGPQTHSRPGLSVFGQIDNFTIHFQPSGFNRLFGIPMTGLTDAAYDAHAVIGAEVPSLEHELRETPGFAGRIQLIEDRLIRMLGCHRAPDPVALAANSLFAGNGIRLARAESSFAELVELLKIPVVATWCAAVVGTVDNFLRPMLVGRDAKMPDLLILIGTLGGLFLFGLIGFIVGPIVCGLFLTVWDIYGTTFREVLPPVTSFRPPDRETSTIVTRESSDH